MSLIVRTFSSCITIFVSPAVRLSQVESDIFLQSVSIFSTKIFWFLAWPWPPGARCLIVFTFSGQTTTTTFVFTHFKNGWSRRSWWSWIWKHGTTVRKMEWGDEAKCVKCVYSICQCFVLDIKRWEVQLSHTWIQTLNQKCWI